MKAYYKNLSIEDIKGEEWRDIPGYDGIYQASSYGRIKSVERLDTIGRLLKEKILNQQLEKKYGGLEILLLIPGQKKQKKHTVGSLVGMAFIGFREDNEVFAHKNKNKLDNRACNIIKTIRSESLMLDYKTGIKRRVSIYMYSSILGEYTSQQLVNKYGKRAANRILTSARRGCLSNGVKWTRTPIQNDNKPNLQP